MNQESSSPRRKKLGSTSEPLDDEKGSIKAVPLDRLAELIVECFGEYSVIGYSYNF